MKSHIAKLKKEKKELAKEISKLKSQRKSSPHGYVDGLGSAQLNFRIKHIAHCVLRGRTKEQIENKWREPDDYWHKWAWKKAEAIVERVREEASNEQQQEVVCPGA